MDEKVKPVGASLTFPLSYSFPVNLNPCRNQIAIPCAEQRFYGIPLNTSVRVKVIINDDVGLATVVTYGNDSQK